MAPAPSLSRWPNAGCFYRSLPGMAGPNQREMSALTLHAADLLPIETPWRGTVQSPLILLETPYRQLIPFSPYDSSMGDANMLFMAKSGGGKTFMAQMFLLMMARSNPLISIVERGDSYRPLVELMGGRVIEVDLEGSETLNPWDLPPGEISPTKDKIAFLKNLTRHMIGDLGQADTSLLDNILTSAIAEVYKRAAIRGDNPTPTYSDLKDELGNWNDEERIEHIRQLAQLASVSLRQWTGEKGVYSKLFDRHTTMRTDANWLFFNIEGLSSDPRLETAMSMLIAQSMSERSSGRSGQASITVLDECWALLDSPVLADCVVQLFRTARKARRQRMGNQPDAGGLCWHEAEAERARCRHSPEHVGKGHRTTAGRRESADRSLGPERSRAERDQTIRGTTQGTKCRDSAGPRRKVRDHANSAARADRSGLLGGDNVSAGAGVSCLVSQGKRRAATDRSLQRTRRAIPAWARGRGSAAGRDVRVRAKSECEAKRSDLCGCWSV